MSVITVIEENFQKEVIQENKTVLVDFWASWCGPCKMLSPIVEQIAEENADVKVCKVNVDEQGMLAQQFNVMSIPTLLVVKNGQIVQTSVGFKSKEAILDMLK